MQQRQEILTFSYYHGQAAKIAVNRKKQTHLHTSMHTTCIPYLLLILVHKITVGPKCQSFSHFNTIILPYVYTLLPRVFAYNLNK